ncbi:MAG: YbhB/YbcL family Raf kinase inhibitor-like protein [Gemmatimonadota bacterium]|nr:YbhB/YbcL family Raf kinase inhibitor-like protein [Gemmatimonadota bacterium]
MAFVLLCNDFKTGDAIPKQYTCDGANQSPPLWWNDSPKGAVSFGLLFVDLDAPGGNLIHWVLFDLPSMTRRLPSGMPGIEVLPQLGRARQTKNDVNAKIGYTGPCPPKGSSHKYVFKLVALDQTLGIAGAAAKPADVTKAMQGHILGSAELLCTYARK